MEMDKEVITDRIRLLTCNANPELAQKVADYLNIPLSTAHVTRFRDGEVRVQIEETVRGADVYVIQPTCAPVNDNLMELLVMMDGLKRASAKSINAVIPYYGYARQERKSKPRDPISAKLVADLLTVAGADRVICMDLHANAIQGFFNIPVDHLSANSLLADFFLAKKERGEIDDDIVVVSPDIGGVARARQLAKRLNCGIVIVDKRRPEPNKAEIMNIVGEVEGKTAILIDDMIDTGGTITMSAEAIMDKGAKEAYICCSHALFSGNAVEKLTSSRVKEIVITDSLPQKPETLANPKITCLSIDTMLGDAIHSIHCNLSVSRLFNK